MASQTANGQIIEGREEWTAAAAAERITTPRNIYRARIGLPVGEKPGSASPPSERDTPVALSRYNAPDHAVVVVTGRVHYF